MIKLILSGTWLALVALALPSGIVEAAYVDPNTGGLLFQLLAASFAILSGFVLVFARRIRIAMAKAARLVRERLGRGERGDSISSPPSD